MNFFCQSIELKLLLTVLLVSAMTGTLGGVILFQVAEKQVVEAAQNRLATMNQKHAEGLNRIFEDKFHFGLLFNSLTAEAIHSRSIDTTSELVNFVRSRDGAIRHKLGITADIHGCPIRVNCSTVGSNALGRVG